MSQGYTNIWVYYRNPQAKTSASGNWTEHFYLFSANEENSCGSWQRFSEMNNYFPRGATSFGGTGGASSHSHSVSNPITNGVVGNTIIKDGAGNSISNVAGAKYFEKKK